MDRRLFYERLIRAMYNETFRLDPEAFSRHDLESDQDLLSAGVRKGLEHLDIVVEVAGLLLDVDIPDSAVGTLDPVFDKESFHQDMRKLYPLTSTVFYKFLLAQPVIAPIVDADTYTSEDFHSMTDRIDRILLDFVKHTASYTTGKWIFKSEVKMSVTAIVLYVFFDSEKAERYISTEQSNCKRFSMRNKTWLVPWAVDVSAAKVQAHRGLPILRPVLNSRKLEAAVFNT